MYKITIFTLILILSLMSLMAYAVTIEKKDTNKDGAIDQWIYFENKRPIKIEIDRNHDKKLDLWITYKEKGEKIIESDLNFDGTVDMRSYYVYGERKKLEIDTDYDGKLDQRSEYNDGKLIKLERDTDGDGILEVLLDRTNLQNKIQRKVIKNIDLNKDSLPKQEHP